MDLRDDIRDLGGLAPAFVLLRRGWSYNALSHAARHGWVLRVRQGWYALPWVDGVLAAAWRVGGLLTCASAARTFGMWAPPDARLHVAADPRHGRMRTADNMRKRLAEHPDPHVHVHWRRHTAADAFRVGPVACLVDLASCFPPEWVLGALDSAIRFNLVRRHQLVELGRLLPQRARWILDAADLRSGSFPESVLRGLLIQAGIGFRIQEWIDDMRVDFLLGDRLVIEVDGREFHGDHLGFENDRTRDAKLSALGYRVLRFSYAQVVHRPDEVMTSIRAALARNDHS
jgi:very-short-patch-repair endonuclease